MAIGTYTELCDALDTMGRRSELRTTMYDIFIAIAESEFNRRLFTSQQDSRDTLTVSNNVASLPSDYLAMRSLSGANGELRYVTPQEFAVLEETTGGDFDVYTIVGDQVRSLSTTTDLTISYYAKIPALTSTSGTNWLLQACPDLYLFRTLAELYGHTLDQDNQGKNLARCEAAYRQIISADQRRKYGANLQVRAN